jgi:hypothetical protein
MNKILKIKFLFILAITSLITTSCGSGWLDIPVEAQEPVASVDYTNISQANDVLYGCYESLYWRAGTWAGLGCMSVRGDDVEKGNPSPTDQYTFTQFHNFDYSAASSFWALGNAWNDHYQSISAMNEAIAAFNKYKEVNTSSSDQALMTKYIAQVRVLRAYLYFRVARLWGDVPVYTDNAAKTGLKRSKFENVMKFIIKEMDEAMPDLENVKPVEATPKGSVTKYTALAVKAKAAAEILDYTDVLSATNDIISAYGESGLKSDFTNLFNNSGNLCVENLLEAQFSSSTNPTTWDDNYFAFQGPAHPIHSVVKFGGANLNGGWGFLPPTTKLEAFLKGRGETVRYTTSILKVGELTYAGDTLMADASKPYPTMYSGKAYNPSTLTPQDANWWGSNNSVRLIRYADILLLNAEAKVKSSQNGDTPFNWVRKRAKMPTLTNVTFDQIMDERFAELCLENGERYYDLTRTGLAATALKSQNYTEAKRFYPIPQTILDNDAALKEPAE